MNRQKFYLLLPVLMIFFSCSSDKGLPSTDIEATNQFVKDIWQNDFKKAEVLLLKDKTNKETLDAFEILFKRKPKEELDKYKKASIILNNIKPLNDSVSIINYSPSFNKSEKNELKLVRKDGQWLIDIKYTIPHLNSLN